jgi:hypothetical protein
MINDIKYYLTQSIVKPFQLKNDPKLNFYDFEFSENNKYHPILLRVLINSINIFNKKYDEINNQESNFPIFIQSIDSESKSQLILQTTSNADILNYLLIKKIDLFKDLDKSIVKKIDLNMEYSSDSNENDSSKIHKKYIDGYLFEKNCMNSFISCFNEDDIIILPNIIFYIKKEKAEKISKIMGITVKNFNDDEMIKKYQGYNEIDMLFILKNQYSFKILKNKFNLKTAIRNKSKIFAPEFKFVKDRIYSVEFKLNSFDVEPKLINKVCEKTNILFESFVNQKYINIENKSNIDFIIISNYCADNLANFKTDGITIDNNIFMFYADVGINYTSLYIQEEKILKLEEKILNLEENRKEINNKNKDLEKKILNLEQNRKEINNKNKDLEEKILNLNNKNKDLEDKILDLNNKFENYLKNQDEMEKKTKKNNEYLEEGKSKMKTLENKLNEITGKLYLYMKENKSEFEDLSNESKIKNKILDIIRESL